MTLIFGKLTASFVTFGNIVLQLQSNPTEPGLLAELVVAQRTLKSEAAKDSLYLVIIGIGMFVATYFYMGVWVYTGEGQSGPSSSVESSMISDNLPPPVLCTQSRPSGSVRTTSRLPFARTWPTTMILEPERSPPGSRSVRARSGSPGVRSRTTPSDAHLVSLSFSRPTAISSSPVSVKRSPSPSRTSPPS